MLKKAFQSMLCLLLAFCLLLGLSANGLVVLAASEEVSSQQTNYNYVSIGASQTNGYGLQGYLPITVNKGQVTDPDELALLNGLLTGQISKDDINVYGYQRAPEGSYPDLIRDALEADGYTVKLDQLAISSMRMEEVRVLLDNDYYGDAYTGWRFYDENGDGWFSSAAKQEGMTNEEALAALRAEYQSAVANANLITMDVGVNNFGVYTMNRISSGLANPERASYDADFSNIFENEEDLAAFQEQYDQIEMLVAEYIGDASAETLRFLVDTLAYALIGFCVNFDKSMEIIYELNPDATVVVVSIQNLLKGMNARFPGVEEEIPLGEIYGVLVHMANVYTASGSRYANRYYYAEAGDVSLFLDDILAYNGDPETMSQDMLDCFGLYDNDLFGWELMLQYGMYPGEDISAGTMAVYGALAEIAQACAQQNVMDMADFADMDAAEDALEDLIETTVEEAFVAGMSGQEYEVDRTVLEDPANATAMAIAIRFYFGNSFYAHPSRKGHQERADAILQAIANESDGRDFTVSTIMALTERIVQYAIKNGYLNPGDEADYVIDADSAFVALGNGTGYAGALGEYLTGIVDATEYGYTYPVTDLTVAGSKITDLDAILEANRDTIVGADLVSLGYSNDVFAEEALYAMFDALLYGTTQDAYDWEALFGQDIAAYIVEQLIEIKASLDAQGMNVTLGEMVPQYAAYFNSEITISEALMMAAEHYAYHTAAFMRYVPTAVADIHEMNPDALVAIVGLGNPFYGMCITLGEETLDLGEMMSDLVEITDTIGQAYAMVIDNVVYVSAPEAETSQTGTNIDTNDMLGMLTLISSIMNKTFTLEITEQGNAYILEQIQNALHVTVAQPEEPGEGEDPGEEEKTLAGDINGDGWVDVEDAMLVLQLEAEIIEAGDLDLSAADVNADGWVDVEDAMLILQFDALLIDKFPVEE